jgi:hypothetical protein
MARKFRNLICIDDRSARGHRHANMPTWNSTKALRRKLRSKSEPRETTGVRSFSCQYNYGYQRFAARFINNARAIGDDSPAMARLLSAKYGENLRSLTEYNINPHTGEAR